MHLGRRSGTEGNSHLLHCTPLERQRCPAQNTVPSSTLKSGPKQRRAPASEQQSQGPARCQDLVQHALQNGSVHLLQRSVREPETLKATDMVKAKDPCVVFSFITQWTGLVLGVSLRQASRREEFRRALSVAVLGYGVTVRVLMLHTLG